MKFSKILPSAGVLAMLVTGPAFAQDAASVEGEDEIVVTGTSIRGIAPAGSSVIGLSEEDITASGALTANELLGELPVAENMFNTLSQPGAGPGQNSNTFVYIPRVQLRPTPGQNLGTNMQTLVLIDGHRLAPMGIATGATAKVYVDANSIPPGMMERVEVITDGGSAIYGSDAVTGVINYITRRRFDGVEVDANYGFADGYERWGHNLTAGTDWGSGSLFGTYNYSQSDALFGRDRDWIREYLNLGTQCEDSTVTIGTQTFIPSQGFAAAPANRCDLTDDRSFAPETYRYAFAGGFSQDLSDTVRFDLRGLIARSVSISYNGALGSTVVIGPNNPYRNNSLPAGNQSVAFNYAPVFGVDSGKNNTTTDLWQITPELTWDLSHDWQFRGMLSHGETELAYRNNGINAAALDVARQSADLEFAINPYNIAASDPDALARLRQSFAGVGQTQFTNARAIVDGPLFSLPAGEVRAAFGLEQSRTSFELRQTGTNTSQLGPASHYDQDVNSQFAELQIPLVSPENEIPFVHSLAAQGSIRHDTYNDVEDATTNSAYGITYEPVEWVSLYANYNESFVAPTAIETAGAGQTTFGADTTSVYELPGNVFNTNDVLTMGGVVDDLEPQTSESYTIGFEVRPPWVEGLSVRASFWHTLLMGRLSSPLRVATNVANHGFFDIYPGATGTEEEQVEQLLNGDAFWILNPTANQLQLLADAEDPDAATGVLAPYIADPSLVDVIYDNRNRNLSRNLVEGWDFGADYVHPTSWGSWDARVSGTVFNLQRQRLGAGLPWSQLQTKASPDYRATVSAGVTVDNFRAQGTVNISPGVRHSSGARIDSYHPLDLFFSYDLQGEGLTEDLRFTLNVNNAFDDEPEGLQVTGVTGANGFSVGRMIQFGVSKRF